MQGRVSNGCRLVGVCFVPSHVGRYKSYVGGRHYSDVGKNKFEVSSCGSDVRRCKRDV